MATKRFKFRISRVISSFQSCRSKDPSILPSNPVPSFLRFSPVKPDPITLHFPPDLQHPTNTAKPDHIHSSLKRHVSSAITSMACGCRSRCSLKYSETDGSESPPTPEFHWKEEEKYHVIDKVFDESPRQKIYNSSVSGDTSYEEDDDVLPPRPPPNSERKKKRRGRKKRTTAVKIHVSTSSAETELFSSTEDFEGDNDNINDEETATLVLSSRSFSTDSSSDLFNPKLEIIRETPLGSTNRRRKRKAVKKGKKRSVSRTMKQMEISSSGGLSSPEIETPARLSMFLQRLIPCTVDGKVRESFAVVKKSEDPYEDFKRSMMEMILEKQMFEGEDLEELLQCFLSLNSRQHHRVIVEAFSEVWEVLFYRRRSSSFRVSTCQN